MRKEGLGLDLVSKLRFRPQGHGLNLVMQNPLFFLINVIVKTPCGQVIEVMNNIILNELCSMRL